MSELKGCEMNKLSPQDHQHLDAAEGWLGLGDHLSANEELEKITPEFSAHPRVLGVRLEIYWKSKNWEAVVHIASALATLKPNNAHGWIGRSFALHELKRTQEAYDLLLPAKDKFPKNLTVPYNLACYCSQLNRLDEAEKWFKKAMAINEQAVKKMAIDDPDLKPLWDSMSGTIWKRE
jgi:tetratricopeptide (TPR) repeat protein